MDFEAAKKFVLGKLKNELTCNLFYHCYNHTLDVYQSAIKYAALENIQGSDLILLKTAALYHDSGFLSGYDNHEEGSVDFTEKHLPDFGYSESEISIIVKMILSTRLPQNPQNILEQILCDADLDYLGRDDFFMIASRLLCEWNIRGMPVSLKKWYNIQADFLVNNNYFTNSAKALRDGKKSENLSLIIELLEGN